MDDDLDMVCGDARPINDLFPQPVLFRLGCTALLPIVAQVVLVVICKQGRRVILGNELFIDLW